jgi:hypothetical protein
MSITRLRQARQMYAQGQRVAKTLDGSRPGYAGPAGGASALGNYGGDSSGGTSANEMSGAGPSNDGPSYHGGGADPISTTPVTETFPTKIQVVDTTSSIDPLTTMSTDPLDIKEQYKIGTKINPPNAFTSMPSVTFSQPYMTKGLETIRKDNYLDKLNLQGATYQPPNLPFYVPGSTLIKTLGSFGFNKNKDFFAKNVAGKYGYGYGLKDFEKYMSDRTSGKVGAYGNENMGQNAINARSGQDGIMDVLNTYDSTDGGLYIDSTDDADGDGDVDQDDFIFRYFDKTGETLQAGAGGVQDLMKSIRKRISNIFS